MKTNTRTWKTIAILGHFFGTGIVEAKPLDEIEKITPIWGPFKPEFAILEYCCAYLYGKV